MLKLSPKIFDDGAPVFLRQLQPEDINDNYLSWFRAPEVTEFLDARNISRDDAISHLQAGIQNQSYIVYAIIAKDSGKHIGNVKIGPIHWTHGFSDLVTVIGDRSYWGKGLATEAVRMGIKIAFGTLGLRKLSAGIADGNEGSIKAYTRAGFVIEGRMKGQLLINGQPQDKIVIACFNPQFFPSEVGGSSGSPSAS